MEHLRAAISLLRCRLTMGITEDDKLLSDSDYDFAAMHQRACEAILATGRTQREIAALMGEDVNIPLYMRQPVKPTMRNINKAARIIGVSVKWLITGTPATEVDRIVERSKCNTSANASNGVGAAVGSAVVQDVTANSISIHTFSGDSLNRTEVEIISALRNLPPLEKAAAIKNFYQYIQAE